MADFDKATEEDQSGASARQARGEFVRGRSGFREQIAPGADFPPEPGRYHLYVALNCPWCHRVTLARSILGLGAAITMDVAFPNRTGDDDPAGPNLWSFDPDRIATLTGAPLPECTPETGSGRRLRLAQHIYAAEGSEERSLPILYDKTSGRIVSNESAEIVRMLNRHAAALGSGIEDDARPDLYPEEEAHETLRREVDALNEDIYVHINNGAYKAGFSSDQNVYQRAFTAYFSMLEKLEAVLAADRRPFLTGAQMTEADLRLFPTLYRHDPIYYVRMKLNGARILDYPHLWRWLCRFYALNGVAEACSLTHCRQGYFGRSWNGVVPLGPTKPMRYPAAYRHPELAQL